MIDVQIKIRNLDTGEIRIDHIFCESIKPTGEDRAFIRDYREIIKEFESNSRILKIRYKRFEENNENCLEKD